MSFAHTPYDGSKQPFTVGLTPMAEADWIEPGPDLATFLSEKERLFAARGAAVFRESPATREAQQEVLELLAAHLTAHFPALYRREGATFHVLPAGRAISLDDANAPPLLTASRLVQEDLCLLQRGETGWRLAAASLCFPSGWSLAEKIGRDMHEIHVPVPGFGGRMENVVARIFDNLRTETPVERFNWSLYGDGRLHRAPDAAPNRFDADLAEANIRVERQTLRRLPRTGCVLFTIRVHTDPIAHFAAHPRGRMLAAGLRAQLLALSEEQARYKGLADVRAMIADKLAAIAAA